MKGATKNLAPALVEVLAHLERAVGMELIINSGYRDPEHNHDVGGVDGSEHTYDPAEGADVLCLRSVTRFKLVREALMCGVTRIGIGKDFVHIGVATDKPQAVIWHYYPTEKKGAPPHGDFAI